MNSDKKIEEIEDENDKIVLKILGLRYDIVSSKEPQCRK